MNKKRIIKFIIAGGSAAAVEYGVFLVLTVTDVWIVIAHSISFVCGLIVSFLLNRTWVFLAKGNTKKQFVQYLLLALTNLVIGSVLILLLRDGLSMQPLVAKFIIMAMIAIWNYAIFSRLIFTQKPTDG